MLWTRAVYGGAEVIEGRERDGIFDTDDVVDVLEATTLYEGKSGDGLHKDRRPGREASEEKRRTGVQRLVCYA